jgi:hypothetical protein
MKSIYITVEMDFVYGNETHVQKWSYFLHTLDARVFFQPKDWQASLVLIVHSLLHRHHAHKILVSFLRKSKYFSLFSSVVDPDSVGSASFWQIRIIHFHVKVGCGCRSASKRCRSKIHNTVFPVNMVGNWPQTSGNYIWRQWNS